MSTYKNPRSLSHRDFMTAVLREDPELAAMYLREAFASLDKPEEREVAMMGIRNVAQAYGGLGKIAQDAGISREALYRALSPKGNPTLNTLLAVLRSVGMRLSVEPVKA